MAARARPRPRSRAAVARLPRPLPGLSAVAARVAPSWRSLLGGLVLLALAGGAYLAALETSMFAVRTIRVDGASPQVAAQVRHALDPLVGKSLLKIGGTDVQRRLAGLVTIAAAESNRDFPHTLRVHVQVEKPLAVLRQGSAAWLVSADGRVLRALPHPRLSSLSRVWLPASASVTPEAVLADPRGLEAVTALRTIVREPIGPSIRDVRTGESELTLMLRSGLEVRLGDVSDLRLKLAVTRKILPQLSPPGYLDVSVPERPVAETNSQVGG